MKNRRRILHRIVACCLVIALILPIFSNFTAQAESRQDSYDEIYNGTFEQGVIGKKVDGWTLASVDVTGQFAPEQTYKDGYQITVGEEAYKGTKSLKISPKDGFTGYVVAESSYMNVRENSSYDITWAMMVSGVENTDSFYGGHVFLTQYDEDKKLIKHTLVNEAPRDDMDWKQSNVFLNTEKGAAYLRIEFFMGGVWGTNKDAAIFIDEVSAVAISDAALQDGGFEKGKNMESVYSWHLSSKNIDNTSNEYGWQSSYIMKRSNDGNTGTCLNVTRKGIGYVSLDSNFIKADGGETYVLDYAVKIKDAVYETFFGVRAYIAEYDKDYQLLNNTMLHTEIRENTDWRELSYTHSVSKETRYIQVQFWIGGEKDSAFTASFDDVALTKIVRDKNENGITNGGFEERFGETIFDWRIDNSKADVKWEATFDGYNGTKGLKVTKQLGDYSFESIQSNTFEVEAGKKYKLNYMVRVADQAEMVYQIAQIVCIDKDGKEFERLRDDFFDHRTTSEEWEQEVSYFTLPAGTVKAKLEFLTCGTGYVCWLDDFKWTVRDENISPWGFDVVDQDGNLDGWTVSQPANMKVDKNVWRNGGQSLFVSQKNEVATTKITSDILIPVNKESHYKFSAYVKSYGSDILTEEGIRMNAICYNEEGKQVRMVYGIRNQLNASDTPSSWREMVCGVTTNLDVAYVRLQITCTPGTMNFWLDDIRWNLYDTGFEYEENFASISSDDCPDGWEAKIVSGKPEFVVNTGEVTINTDADSEGYIAGKWKMAKEYLQYDVKVKYSSKGSDARFTIRYYDYKGDEIKDTAVTEKLPDTDGQVTEYTFITVIPSASYAKLEFGGAGEGSASIYRINITESVTVLEGDTAEDWRGKWIWHYEDNYSVEYQKRYFRYNFTLPEAPTAGLIQLTADNEVSMWVNGIEVSLEGNDSWEDVSVVDSLANYLTAGDNTIAMEVYNIDSAAGLLFDGFAEMASGERVDFYSTDAVISSTTVPEGWQAVDFDDSTWTQCRILGNVGVSPWSSLPFDVSAYVTDVIEVKDYTITQKLTAGETATLSMTIIPQVDVKRELDFTGTLWIRNTLKDVVSVSMTQVKGPATNEWKEGEAVEVVYEFVVPDILTSGKYTFQMDVNKIKIANDDMLNNKFTKAIQVTNEMKEPTITSEIKTVNGTTALYINGEARPNISYVEPTYQSFVNGQANEYFHDADICVSTVFAYVGSDQVSYVWTGEDEYDFTPIDQIIYEELSLHEDTMLMLWIGLDVPAWWKEANPDELVIGSGETQANHVSFFSKKFADDSIKANKALMEYIMKQPYANRIMGLKLSACETSEWLWYGTGQHAIDYSPVAVEGFREYLKKKYETDEELQKAWNNKNVTLETAQVPTSEEREGLAYTVWLDPERQQSTIDFHEALADVNVNLLKRFAAEMTEATDNRIIMGAYYGYMNNAYYYGGANGLLHLGVEQALEDENLDFFAAPVPYGERYDGEAGTFMTMVDSILAHGKAFMQENDNRSSSYMNLGNNFYVNDYLGSTYTVWDSISQIERDFAMQITKGTSNWYFNMWGNFFLNEQFSEVMETLYDEMKLSLERQTESKQRICYIIDEDMYTYLAYGDFYSNYDMLYNLMYVQRQELAKVGIPCGMYYMSDLAKGLIPEYDVYIMLSPVDLDAEERAAIDKYCKKNNSTIIWQYACGLSDGNTLSAKNMEEVIGMNIEVQTDTREFLARFSEKKHTLIQGIEGTTYGVRTGRSVISPAMVITDKEADVLGTYDGTQDACIATKDMGDWTSVYTAVPCLPTEFLVNLLKEKGIHLYSENKNDVIMANNNYVAINSAFGERKTITLEDNYSIYDVFLRQSYSLDTSEITIDMEDNSTRLFRLMTPGTHAVYTETSEGGSVNVTGYNEYKDGEDVKLTFKADKGYILSSVIIDGEESEVSESKKVIKFKDIDNSHYVQAKFKKLTEEEKQVIAEEKQQSVLIIIVVALGVAVVAGGTVCGFVIYRKRHNKKTQEQ